MGRTTEQASRYNDLERLSIGELLRHMNTEDATVPTAIAAVLPQLERLVEAIAQRMARGGRLFYLGAGTSGRLGIVDASECPPTFGIPHGMVVGLIAGGDGAIRRAVEFAEDDEAQGWKDILPHEPATEDTLIGIAASGSTPYVVGALRAARNHGLLTGCVTCNANSAVAEEAEHAIEVIVGPEFVTGSTRLKSGTAQKLVLNMISTCVMIKLGRVKGNRMVDMQLSNSKLIDRGTRMVMDALGLDYDQANALLLQHGSVRKAMNAAR
jgi:N-acetylmuramic acid 6-phosphate etherase